MSYVLHHLLRHSQVQWQRAASWSLYKCWASYLTSVINYSLHITDRTNNCRFYHPACTETKTKSFWFWSNPRFSLSGAVVDKNENLRYLQFYQLSTLYLDWPKQLTQCVKQYWCSYWSNQSGGEKMFDYNQSGSNSAAEMKTQTWTFCVCFNALVAMTTTVTTSQPKDFHCRPLSLHPHVTVKLCFLSWSGVFLFPSVSCSRLRAFTCRLPDQVSPPAADSPAVY